MKLSLSLCLLGALQFSCIAAMAADSVVVESTQTNSPAISVPTQSVPTQSVPAQSAPTEAVPFDSTPVAGRPFTIQLPDSWEVSELKAPKSHSGKEMDGGRLRALKKDGAGIAVIELTYMPRNDGGQADIDSEFAAFITQLKSEYESKGLTATASAPKTATLSKLPSREVEIKVNGQNKELGQWFSMAMGKHYVYALSYTGQKEFYDKFQVAFDKCRDSLVME
jgi:hypothetical protein